jgi:hypothetical protein
MAGAKLILRLPGITEAYNGDETPSEVAIVEKVAPEFSNIHDYEWDYKNGDFTDTGVRISSGWNQYYCEGILWLQSRTNLQGSKVYLRFQSTADSVQYLGRMLVAFNQQWCSNTLEPDDVLWIN